MRLERNSEILQEKIKDRKQKNKGYQSFFSTLWLNKSKGNSGDLNVKREYPLILNVMIL